MLTMWAIKMPGYRGAYTLNSWIIKRTRKSAIAEWLSLWDRSPNDTWRYWYRQGYRCVRVRVTEIES